ncbi:MAG: biotin transporter BioY [Phycisphaerae bacterium]|nr:biotin transporter BioY [Planctomycetota bacterium]MBL7107491.1 biotin transporter BioY [Phycisphaerae bacterium]
MLTGLTVADCFRPSEKKLSLAYNTALVLTGSAVIAISAQIAIPFFPVPFTAQTFAILVIGALLGSRLGILTVLAYICEGILGLPVFSMGRAGAAMLLGPTGGYLIGFTAAAFIVGTLAERGWDRSFTKTIAAMTLGTLAIYIFGVAWLSRLIGFHQALIAGLYPFVIGAVLKIFTAAILLPAGWKLLKNKK